MPNYPKYYHGLKPQEISPYKWPAKEGELTILLDKKPGYCALVIETREQKAFVRLLDSIGADSVFEVPLNSCIPTRKTPLDIISLYKPSLPSFVEALQKERSLPDFNSPALAKSRKKGGSKKKEVKKLSNEELLKALLTLDEEKKKSLGFFIKNEIQKKKKK
jgi:hypothetical protein